MLSPRVTKLFALPLLLATSLCGVCIAGLPQAQVAAAISEGVANEAPARGRTLVATRRIRGNLFERSVVFLTDYDEHRALGMIVNLPTDKPLGEVFEGLPQRAGRLHVGGPVDSEYMMVLMRSATAPKLGRQIVDDIYLTGDEAALRGAAAAPDAASNLRVFAGHAGWSAGQLDREIARGDWLVVEIGLEALFDASPVSLWEKLWERHRRLIAAPSDGDVGGSIDRAELPRRFGREPAAAVCSRGPRSRGGPGELFAAPRGVDYRRWHVARSRAPHARALPRRQSPQAHQAA